MTKHSHIFGTLLIVILVTMALLFTLSGCFLFETDKPTTNTPTKLSAPTLSYDEDTQTLSWNKVEDARVYLLRRTAGDKTETFTTASTSFSVNGWTAGDYQVTVEAHAADSRRNSAPSAAVTVSIHVALSAPESVRAYRIGGYFNAWLVWDPVENASGYLVDNGEDKQTVTKSAISLSDASRVTITVLGEGGYLDSPETTYVPVFQTASAHTYALNNTDGITFVEGDSVTVDGMAVDGYDVSSHNLPESALVALSLGEHILEVWKDDNVISAHFLTLLDKRPPVLTLDGNAVGNIDYVLHHEDVTLTVDPLACTNVNWTLLDANGDTVYEAVQGDLNKVVLSAAVLDTLPTGNCLLKAQYTCHNGDVETKNWWVNIRSLPMQLLADTYVFSGQDLSIEVATNGDSVRDLYLNGSRVSTVYYSAGPNSLVLDADYLFSLPGSSVTFSLYTNSDAVLEFTVTLAVTEGKGLALAQLDYTYDKGEGGNLSLEGTVHTDIYLLGASITDADYTDTVGGSVVLKEDYLQSLAAGSYRYVGTDGESRTYFNVTVVDSRCAPSALRLNYDLEADRVAVQFAHECGQEGHSFVLDGGEPVLSEGFTWVEGVDRSKAHTLVVTCSAHSRSTTLNVPAPSESELEYINRRFSFMGYSADYAIGSQEEFNFFVQYLTFGGGYDATKGEYGVSMDTVWLTDQYMEVISNYSESNTYLGLALDSFDSPYSTQISSSGSGNRLTVTLTFRSPVLRSATTGMVNTGLVDTRELLTKATDDWTPYDGYTRSQQVHSLAEWMVLPLDVRPLFGLNNDLTRRAKEVYEKAMYICDYYLSDTMTDRQKVTVIYDYLTTNVCYDDYTLVWYDLYARAFGGYGLSEIQHIAAMTATSYADNPIMTAYFQRVAAATSLEALQATLNDIMHGLSSFDAYGALVEGYSVCEGIADAFILLCRLNGIECIKITGLGVNNGGSENHAWNKVYIDGAWYGVDATWGRSSGLISHRFLLVSDVELTKDHLENVHSAGEEVVVKQLADGEYDYYTLTKVGTKGYDLSIDSQAELKEVVSSLVGEGHTTIELHLTWEISSIKQVMKSLNIACTYSYADGYIVICI